MTAESDIAAIDDGGANTAAEVRTALTSILGSGWVVSAAQPGVHFMDSGVNATASRADAVPISIPGMMAVRAFGIRVSIAGTGAHQWGLFDYSSDPTAATKIAGGSGALGSTGFLTIAAASAPVTINPGNYILVFHRPATNQATVRIVTSDAGNGAKQQSPYTWSDTPDLSTGWGVTSIMLEARLIGDLVAGTQW